MSIEETVIDHEGEPTLLLLSYRTPHVGDLLLKITLGQHVQRGSVLYTLKRNGVFDPILATHDGNILSIDSKSTSCFDAYRLVLVQEHTLTPEEKQLIKEEREYTFINAKVSAHYYLTPKKGAENFVHEGDIIQPGQQLGIAMVMKKQRAIIYNGPPARLARIYFVNGELKRINKKEKAIKLFGYKPLGHG